MTFVVRHPAVAGRFYPRDAEGLCEEVNSYLSQGGPTVQASATAIGCIAPHAGYMYSGRVAGGEHAVEVELPFLLARQPKLSFVPIALGTTRLDVLEQLGLAIADVISATKSPVLIVASSDMNHYESDAVTRAKDHWAIERILTLDARGLHEVVGQQNISMCGVGPAVAMLTAAKKLGAKSAELVKYATSGDVSGDRDMVVGYAGVVVR